MGRSHNGQPGEAREDLHPVGPPPERILTLSWRGAWLNCFAESIPGQQTLPHFAGMGCQQAARVLAPVDLPPVGTLRRVATALFIP